MTETINNTTVLPEFITDSTGAIWSLVGGSPTRGTQIARNGVIQTPTGFVTMLLYWNHTVYQENSTPDWWYWDNSTSAWVFTSDPRTTTITAAISGITLSNTSFSGGAASGTVVSSIVVSMSDGTWSGALALAGTNALSFQIVGGNLVTNGVVAAGTYDINVTATQAGATGSPFSQTFTITANAVAAPAITDITLSNSSFVGGAASGTVVGTVAVSMSSGSFSGTLSLSGTNVASFQLVGNNLVTSGAVAAGSYNVTVTAIEAGVTGSPFSHTFAITATSSGGTVTAPPQAAGAGFHTLTFSDDFTTASTIATSATAASGYKWYWSFSVGSYVTSASWSVNPTAAATGSNASANGGILTLNSVRGSHSGFWGNSTLCTLPGRAINNGQIPAGTAWQHGYFEMYGKTSPDGLGSNSPMANGWPAFWSWSAEGASSFGFSNLSGPSTEVDFMEVTGGVNWGNSTDPVGHDAATVHNPGGSTTVYSTGFPTMDSNWHTWGCLWTPGAIQFYYDNVAVGSSHSTSGWNLENTHLFVILGTGIGWPMEVDWVRVWTA